MCMFICDYFVCMSSKIDLGSLGISLISNKALEKLVMGLVLVRMKAGAGVEFG